MKILKIKLVVIVVSAILVCSFLVIPKQGLGASISSNNDPTVVITDIANWKHPVKDVLMKKNIKIFKVELLKNKTYPIFYLGFDSELDSRMAKYFEGILNDIAAANGYWDYKVIDEKNKIKFEVQCDKQNKIIKNVITNSKSGLLKEMVDYNEKMAKKWDQVMAYLEKNVPEISQFRAQIKKASHGEVNVMMRLDDVPDKYSNDEYRDYYCIYVGEDHSDHTVRWHTFYVSSDLSKILVDVMPDFNFVTIDQWRKTNK